MALTSRICWASSSSSCSDRKELSWYCAWGAMLLLEESMVGKIDGGGWARKEPLSRDAAGWGMERAVQLVQ